MHTWFKINLGDAMLANESLSDLKVRLTRVYEVAGRPECMLAIYRHETAGLHCNVVVYLTRKFQEAARLDDAVSCNIPPFIDSGLLVGDKAMLS